MIPQDGKKLITAEDILRLYNLKDIKSNKISIQKLKETINGTNEIVEEYVKAITKNINELQDQVDGTISTWFFNGVPTLENTPANEWTTNEDKNVHLGDLYYDQDTGYAYRFAFVNNSYEWIKITDSDVTKALAIANSAQDTADSKRRVFVTSPSPPYEVGDIWIKEDKDLYRCRATRSEGDYSEADWIKATDYSNDDYAKNVEAVLNQLEQEIRENYTTIARLETMRDSILADVSATTTEIKETLNEKATIEDITEVNQSIVALQNATSFNLTAIENIQVNGVSKLKTSTGFSFDIDGIHLVKDGAPTGLNQDEAGMEIIDKTGEEEKTLAYMGYATAEIVAKNPELAKYLGQTVSFMQSLIVNGWIEFFRNYRLQETTDDTYGKGIGLFYVGDEN